MVPKNTSAISGIKIKCKMIKVKFLSILFLISYITLGQQKLELIAPTQKLLPRGDFFLAADFNNWDPGDPRFQFKKKQNGNYEVSIPDSIHVFEYKITQGTWHLVEGSKDGGVCANRKYDDKSQDSIKNYTVQLVGWEKKATYRIIVNKIPTATPFDAKLYISGNFNNWNPRDDNYLLIKHSDGSYRATIQSELTEIQYKITRGNWASVECYGNGKARPNRKIGRSDHLVWNPRDIEHKTNIEVENWEENLNEGTANSSSDDPTVSDLEVPNDEVQIKLEEVDWDEIHQQQTAEVTDDSPISDSELQNVQVKVEAVGV
jgi:hypothetical protein